MKKSFAKNIKEHISNADLKLALEETIAYFKNFEDDKNQNELIILLGQYTDAHSKFMAGLLLRENYNNEIAKINYALLEIIDARINLTEDGDIDSQIEGYVRKFDIIVSGIKSNSDEQLVNFAGSIHYDGVHTHVKHAQIWAETIIFRDLKKEKNTLQTYVDLDYFVIPKSLHLEHENPEKINLLSIFNHTQKHIVILGQPGAGKTTTMKRLVHFLVKEHEERLKHFSHPVVIRLREWNGYEEKSLLIEILTIYGFKIEDPKAFLKKFKASVYSIYLHRFLNRLQFLLILDGFDELKQELRTSLLKEIKQLSSILKKSKIIITSRPGEKIMIGDTFKEFEICPLSEHQIKKFITKWIGDDREADILQGQITNSPFSDTITRPLTLSHLCALYERNKKIPVKPKTIYRKIVNLLLEEWDDQRGITRTSKYSKFEPDRKTEFLSYLAFNITTKFKKISFSKQELREAYKAICHNFNLPEDEEKIVIGELESHTGIFIQSGYQKFEFAHKSIQEFLSAEYIVRLPSFPKENLLSKIPTELALANSISINPTNYFSALVFSRLLNRNLSVSFLEVFFNRLALEKPEFYADKLLGISYLSTFSWLVFNTVKSDKDFAALTQIRKMFREIANLITAFQASIELMLENYATTRKEEELDKIYLSNTCNALGLNRYEANVMFSFGKYEGISLLKQTKPVLNEHDFSIPQYLLLFDPMD